jgi:hypothetical protein
MIKLAFIALVLLQIAGAAMGQTVTIPVDSMSFTVTINGTKYKAWGPNVALTLPVVWNGVTWTPAVGSTPAMLTIAGDVSMSRLLLHSGNPMPTCASNQFLWGYTPSTNTLAPNVCYVPPTFAGAAK